MPFSKTGAQMDSKVKLYRSLPPMVEGKIHGNLKLVIDEILWIKKSPGNVTVVASWWGEHDSAQFRLVDGPANAERTIEDTTEIYAIKTNTILFEDYIKNCETIELIIIKEETRKVVGTARIGELFKIFTCEPYFQYIPISSNRGNKIGEINVSLQLTYLTKSPNMQLKAYKYDNKLEVDDILLSDIGNVAYNEEISGAFYKDIDNIKGRNFVKPTKLNTYYKSVLKAKRPEVLVSKKLNEITTDKIIAQIVARAQRLRGVILKETYNEDPLSLSSNSSDNGPCASLENEAKLYEYILGKEMSTSEEKQALHTLRSTSPTPSLIDLASKTIMACEYDNMNANLNRSANVLHENTAHLDSKETYLLDYVDRIRIFIESFTLNPAGYRRAKSTCIQRGIPLSLTYFVQYDATFGCLMETNLKCNRETKFVKTYAKKQIDQVIDFNSEGVYDISRYVVNTDFSVKFKIFTRNLNQKLPTVLGCSSINISDVRNSKNLSTTQRLTVINKGIKVGELKVTIELGCDLHFGKEFVDSIISTKENIPVLDVKSSINDNDNKCRNMTGTCSSKSSKASSVSAKRIGHLASSSSRKNFITANTQQSLDNKKIDTSNPEMNTKDKVLLHGLIYVAEGKDLPESNTYLISRAFWREDKAISQICNNTKNPFYHFCQLVPLIHSIELLERIKDNYIIIEVYSRQSNRTDNLIGIAKLPVHQLYIAYRDPTILSCLLLSKYPVISVDGWVNINDPISGKSCGELLALVALGTPEQIALLQVSRGLRNSGIVQTVCNYHHSVADNANSDLSTQESLQCNIPQMSSNSKQSSHHNLIYCDYDSTSNRDLISADYKTQESQTDISSLNDTRLKEATLSECINLHTLVDRLVNVLHVNKVIVDQSAQTDATQINMPAIEKEEICNINATNTNSLSDEVDISISKNNFQLPTEMYRSVGVGAEFDEELDQEQTNIYNNTCSSYIIEENAKKEEINTTFDDTFFRAVVEIECALHLPKIEKINGQVEPSTYVTFQNLSSKVDSDNYLNSYMITNIFPHSSNPKWNWKCDAKLPTELLLNKEKRLIIKVWHLMDSDISSIINLEKDIVIGFSAIDLSVLMAGFPTISGWFHIVDFTGKCNGQIKIKITPLDSLPFSKCMPPDTINLPACNLSQASWPYFYKISSNDAENSNEEECIQNDTVLNADYNLDDVSMSFLSLSLKQKLTELGEITMRLQSRLRDVTNTAFEDEFENDFDMIETHNDNENIDNKNAENVAPTIILPYPDKILQAPKHKIQNDRDAICNEKHTSVINSNYNERLDFVSNQSKAVNSEVIDTGYCSSSNTYFNQNYSQCNSDQYRHTVSNNHTSDYNEEYPVRGTRMPISHLLDKLSSQIPFKPISATTSPIKTNIIELLTALRENNTKDKIKSNNDVNYSVFTQNDNTNIQDTCTHAIHRLTPSTSDVCIDENVPKLLKEVQPSNRISTLIREELVTEENNGSSNCDELTTYLITSNVRHTDMKSAFHPLFYQHLVPDIQITSATSPEEEDVKQLDNRYAQNFDTMMSNSPNRINQPERNNATFKVGAQIENVMKISESEDCTESFCLKPSNVLINYEDNIDVTVIDKSNNYDLTASNNTGSTITLFEKSLVQQNETEAENYCSTEVSRQAPDGGNPIEEIKPSLHHNNNKATNFS